MYGIVGGPQGRYRVAVRERGFCPCLRWGRLASWVPVCGGLGAVVGEVAGQLPVGVDLGEEVVGLLLNRCDRVGSCDPARRRVLPPGERYEGGARANELYRELLRYLGAEAEPRPSFTDDIDEASAE